MNTELTLERLKERLDYSPETGIFVWRETFSGMCRKGWPAGRQGTGKAAGYMRINVDGVEYKAHRLAWFYVTGEWPKGQLDHINMVGTDNRLANLRECTQSQNKANSRVYKNSKSGVKGVTWRKDRNCWQACIQKDGKQKHLGFFGDINSAASAYKKAAEAMYGDFHRT